MTTEKFFECNVYGHIYEDGETALSFTEPKKNGKRGKMIFICDPSEQSTWEENSKKLCITKYIENGNFGFKRLNFRRIYFTD